MSGYVKNFEIRCGVTGETFNKNVLINEARNGAGNDYIFHTSLESINKLILINQSPKFVIIQWSGPNRRMYCDQDGSPHFVNLYDNIEYFIKFEPMASLHTVHYMYSLQEFLKAQKIEYLFIPYFGLDETANKSLVFNLLDMSRIIDFDMGYEILMNGAIKYIIENGLNRDIQGHPKESGYEDIARRVLVELNRKMTKNIV